MQLTEGIAGFVHHRGWLGAEAQEAMVEDIWGVIRAAPLVRPVTAWGESMTVRMTSAGRVCWVIDRGRYRYSDNHPEAGTPWPAIPEGVLAPASPPKINNSIDRSRHSFCKSRSDLPREG